ncbi:hypothetical protein FAM8407_02918 [Lacticaseibacillus paracasei]|jgi:hypothetical protein|nr:hypothetical protein FAM18110_02832 [Lacticaseibacillus paracasei]RND99844.1 hypothetical protein FAM22277_02893 [Lacticaseibacillus paracasei]RNE41975.1 hypothetical protein FAM8407_02918 [Lacticaseibacillus paracasei]
MNTFDQAIIAPLLVGVFLLLLKHLLDNRK